MTIVDEPSNLLNSAEDPILTDMAAVLRYWSDVGSSMFCKLEIWTEG